jgi:hypothetical protein
MLSLIVFSFTRLDKCSAAPLANGRVIAADILDQTPALVLTGTAAHTVPLGRHVTVADKTAHELANIIDRAAGCPAQIRDGEAP